jgi:hypothetical protein
MQKCKYFKIQELVHPDFLKMTDEDTLWKIFDIFLLSAIDLMRDFYKTPIIINGGGLVDCGLRLPDSKTGAKFSAHKYGRAFDLHFESIEKQGLSKPDKIKCYNEVREQIMRGDTKDSRFNWLNFETDIYWLHIDTFNRPNRLFKP